MDFPLLVLAQATEQAGQNDPAADPSPANIVVADTEWLIETARQLALDWGLKLIGALTLLIVTWIVASWLRRLVHRAINRPHVDQTFGRFFGNLVRWLVIAIGIVACLGVFGVNTTSLAAMVGAAGLAIGLALQGSLANLAAGIMLLMLRPFKVGDFVQVGSVMGTVYEIELFTVKLNGPDFRRIVLPNSMVFGSVIENFTHNPHRRADVLVGVAYSADTVITREVLMRAVRSVEGVMTDPPPEVFLNDLGASSVNWRVSGWVVPADWGKVRQAITEAVKKHLEAANISIPFQQMEVRLLGTTSHVNPD